MYQQAPRTGEYVMPTIPTTNQGQSASQMLAESAQPLVDDQVAIARPHLQRYGEGAWQVFDKGAEGMEFALGVGEGRKKDLIQEPGSGLGRRDYAGATALLHRVQAYEKSPLLSDRDKTKVRAAWDRVREEAKDPSKLQTIKERAVEGRKYKGRRMTVDDLPTDADPVVLKLMWKRKLTPEQQLQKAQADYEDSARLQQAASLREAATYNEEEARAAKERTRAMKKPRASRGQRRHRPTGRLRRTRRRHGGRDRRRD